jgi:integrase
LPAVLGLLAFTRALRLSRPSLDAAIAVGFLLGLRPMSIRGLQSDDFSITPTSAFIRLRREKGNAGHHRDRVIRLPLATAPDSVFKLLSLLSQCKAGTPLFPFTSARLNHHLIRLSNKGAQSPPPLGRFTCRSLRSGCISAAHAIGVPLSRIMALSGHSSTQVLIRHYLDASISPCPSARELFGRLLPPSSS